MTFNKSIQSKLFCLLFLHLFLVSCADEAPAPVEPIVLVEEPAPVEIVEEVEVEVPVEVDPEYYSSGGARVRTQYYDHNIFYGELLNIPIPEGLVRHNRFSDVKFENGVAQGVEVYMGEFNLIILSERMKQNMYDHYWELQASEITEDGEKISQVYTLGGRTAIINFSKRIFDIRLDVWSNDYNSSRRRDDLYIAPSNSTTNPINREDLLPRH